MFAGSFGSAAAPPALTPVTSVFVGPEQFGSKLPITMIPGRASAVNNDPWSRDFSTDFGD